MLIHKSGNLPFAKYRNEKFQNHEVLIVHYSTVPKNRALISVLSFLILKRKYFFVNAF